MKPELIILFATIIYLSVVQASFINPYPRFQKYHDGGDPGEPLFLTPFIQNGSDSSLAKARHAAKVTGPKLSSVMSYSGYITVSEQFNSNMFFWYFPATTNPKNASVVLWLQGGPGASSLFGLFTENGPFAFDKNGELTEREYSWHKNHHLIYIDNPVGTGFSFTDHDEGYVTNESQVGRDLLEAITQIFTLFPNFQSLPFFITGESYAGKYVPAAAFAIHKSNKRLVKLGRGDEIKINLKGIAIGNGLSDPIHQLHYGDYLYQIGLIDLNGRNVFHDYEQKGADCIKSRNMTCAFDVFDELINMDQLPSGSLFKNFTGFETYFNYLRSSGDGSDKILGNFLQSTATRKGIHVGNNSFHDLEGENKVEEHLKNDIMDSVAPWIAQLLSTYRVCIYNGQLDIIVAYPLTEAYLQKLKFDGAKIYKTAKRHIWRVDDEIAGYAKEAGNLVEVLVRNAGHMAPGDQPKWVLNMITRLTSGKGFSSL